MLFLTYIKSGTLSRAFGFIKSEQATGVMQVSFGEEIPIINVDVIDGDIIDARFGELRGADVLDLLLCQELAIKEIKFEQRHILLEFEQTIDTAHSALEIASKAVRSCQARSRIYGKLPVKMQPCDNDVKSIPVLSLLHDFSRYADSLQPTTELGSLPDAPLHQCALISRALDTKLLQYTTPLVKLKSLRPLLELIQPLEEKESENLHSYMRHLLSHEAAAHMVLERFYALAAATESIAYRKGPDIGDACRKVIHKIIQDTQRGDDLEPNGLKVPAGKGPGGGSSSAELEELTAEQLFQAGS